MSSPVLSPYAHLKTKPGRVGHRTVYYVESFGGACYMCAGSNDRSACVRIKCDENQTNGKDSIALYKEDLEPYTRLMTEYKLEGGALNDIPEEAKTYKTPVKSPIKK